MMVTYYVCVTLFYLVFYLLLCLHACFYIQHDLFCRFKIQSQRYRRHLSYGVTQCYLPPDINEHTSAEPQPVSKNK